MAQRLAECPATEKVPLSTLALTWAFAVERVTGIEPALSAWESVQSAPSIWPDLWSGLSVSDRESPSFTRVNGPLMARLLDQVEGRPSAFRAADHSRAARILAGLPEMAACVARWFRPGLRSEDCRGPGREDSQPVQPAMVPVGSQLSGVLAVMDVADRVTVPPLLKMPPPWAAVLPVTSL